MVNSKTPRKFIISSVIGASPVAIGGNKCLPDDRLCDLHHPACSGLIVAGKFEVMVTKSG